MTSTQFEHPGRLLEELSPDGDNPPFPGVERSLGTLESVVGHIHAGLRSHSSTAGAPFHHAGLVLSLCIGRPLLVQSR